MTYDDGSLYRPNYISDLFREIVVKHKLPKIRLHDLRHSFASIGNDLGLTIFDIGKALGHSNSETTSRIYIHAFDKQNTSIISNIGNSIANASAKVKA